MKPVPFIQSLAITLLAFAAVAEDAQVLVCELRIPTRVQTNAQMSIELTTETHSDGTRLRFAKERSDGEFRVFQHSFLLFSDRRRALVVDDEPSQVFVLSIARNPKPADWTEWRYPDYLAKGGAGWDFMHDQNKHARSTNLPPDCFQFRYKIEKMKNQ
jgi:hypothetical protein